MMAYAQACDPCTRLLQLSQSTSQPLAVVRSESRRKKWTYHMPYADLSWPAALSLLCMHLRILTLQPTQLTRQYFHVCSSWPVNRRVQSSPQAVLTGEIIPAFEHALSPMSSVTPL